MSKIKVGIIGVGSCAKSLVEGIQYYNENPEDKVGLMYPDIGGYKTGDIEFVCGFDVDIRKVNKPLPEALRAKPNCSMHHVDKITSNGNGNSSCVSADAIVYSGPELDGIARSEGDDIILLICKDALLIKEQGWNKAIKSGKLSPYFVGEINGKNRFIYECNRPYNLDIIPYAAWDLLESDPYGHNLLEDYIKVPVWGLAANNSSATPFTMKRSLTTVSSRGCPMRAHFAIEVHKVKEIMV